MVGLERYSKQVIGDVFMKIEQPEHPLHFPVALFLLKKNKPVFLIFYFRLVAVIAFINLVAWPFLPQDLHYSLIPLVVLILIRSIFIQQRILHQKRSREKQSLQA